MFYKFTLNCDAPWLWGVYFQDSASPQMEALVELHDKIMFYLVIIFFGVAWIMASITRNYISSKSPINNKHLNHGTLIELIWTITPALILILIAFPSFKLLYLMDEVIDPSLTVFAEGHQWYWSYQYPDFLYSDDEELYYNSYLELNQNSLNMNDNETEAGESSQTIILPDNVTNNTRRNEDGYIDFRCFKMPRFLYSTYTSTKFFVYDSNDYNLEAVKQFTQRVHYETVSLPKDDQMYDVTGFRRSKLPRVNCVEVLLNRQHIDNMSLKDKILVEGNPALMDDSNPRYYKIRVPIKNNE